MKNNKLKCDTNIFMFYNTLILLLLLYFCGKQKRYECIRD